MNLFSLNKKIAVVTGGYGHLGSEMSKCLAQMGATVIVAARNRSKYEKAFSSLEKKTIKFVELDITSDLSIKSCFSKINKAYKSIDILINNAISLKTGKPNEVSRKDWNYSLDGILASLNSCITNVIPYMERSGGSIINISSMYGVVSPDFKIYNDYPEYFNSAQYGAAKAAAIQLTRYYANYLSGKNIRVNCITPGPFPSLHVQKSKGFIKQLVNRVPLKRIGKPEDLSGVLILLASGSSSFITGQNIIVDGGWTIV